MSSDVMANFSCLDELTQVIYQSVYRFVVLSHVSDEQWTIYLGLSGPEGRWWRGIWREADILDIVGSKSSDKLLETFANKLAETFLQGELSIGDWEIENGAKINLTLGPSAKKPLHMPLKELSPVEAASHATDIFMDIAIHAQSRKCRLHPSPQSFLPSITSLPAHDYKASVKPITSMPHASADSNSAEGSTRTSTSSERKAQEEIKLLKTQLEQQKKRTTVSPPATNPKVAPRPLKGASLANPNKKARKYQAIEFESDDE